MVAKPAQIKPLLRHGNRFLVPDQEIVQTATWLAKLGIIEQRQSLVVRCADPLDRDFPPLVDDCTGWIALRSGADEGGGEYRCPSCERPVFPVADEKHRYQLLTVVLNPRGIEAHLIECCGEPAAGRTFQDGVLSVPTSGLNAFVCLVDFCADQRFLRRGAAIAQPCIYVTVEPDAADRVLKDDGISHIELAAILAGTVDLAARLTERATSAVPAVSNVDVPVYSVGAAPIGPQAPKPEPQRQFVICWSAAGLTVDGLLVVEASRTTACRILRALIDRFAADIVAGNNVRPMSADELADKVDQDADDALGADNVRRTVDRVRDEISNTVRRESGRPIWDNYIIETVSRTGALKGAKGYRLNPRTVSLGAPMI